MSGLLAVPERPTDRDERHPFGPMSDDRQGSRRQDIPFRRFPACSERIDAVGDSRVEADRDLRT